MNLKTQKHYRSSIAKYQIDQAPGTVLDCEFSIVEARLLQKLPGHDEYPT